MNRLPVTSSNLKSVGYDAQAFLLEIEFVNGRTYQYQGVEAWLYEALLNGESAGKTFFKYIRGKYEEREVTGLSEAVEGSRPEGTYREPESPASPQ